LSWIETIDESQATGLLKEIYDQFSGQDGVVPNIIKIHSIYPEVLRDHMALFKTIMFGPSGLSRTEREAVATVVSKLNDCFY
jgi:uncharacterized peroxidase-related enzyme